MMDKDEFLPAPFKVQPPVSVMGINVLRPYNNGAYLVGYDKGIMPLHHDKVFPNMPDNILKASKMSLWSLSLEIHTRRFFRVLLGDFYILLVPLSGLVSIMVVLSGYLLWRKKHRKKNSCISSKLIHVLLLVFSTRLKNRLLANLHKSILL